MAGRPRTRAKRHAEMGELPILEATQRKNRNNTRPKHEYLADIYAERYTTWGALRQALVQNGIIDHGLNPYDVIQRAIDDTTTDYILIRQRIEKETHGDPELLVQHPLYEYMESVRESAVRYATFATQYDIQTRQMKLSESRIAVLAHALRTTLEALGLNQDEIKKAPKLLIEAVQSREFYQNSNATQSTRIDPVKAEALAEILHHDSDIEIVEVETMPDKLPPKPPRQHNKHKPTT